MRRGAFSTRRVMRLGSLVLDWELRDPAFLLLGLLAPLVYVLAARVGAAVTYSSLSLVDAAPTLAAST